LTLAWGFTQEAPNEILILANDLEQTLALDKLIDRGNRFFPKELSTMLLGRWEAVARDPKGELRFDFAEIDERLGGFQFYGSFIPAELNLSLEQIEGFSKLLRSKK